MRRAVLVDVVRTPFGKGRDTGALAGVHPVDLLAGTLEALVARAGIDPDRVEDVIAGCVLQVGEQAGNIGRHATLAAGFGEHVPATTLDRKCGSSQQALHFAAQGVMAGAYDVVIACGVEMMSAVPARSNRLGRDELGPRFHERYPDGLVRQGISAELIAARWAIPRDELDAFALRSHRLAAAARDDGRLAREITPVRRPDGALVEHDEGIRDDTTIERLAGLQPAFTDAAMAERFPEISWSVTAGSSSQITDGAAAALVVAEDVAEALDLTPTAALRGFSVVGSDPIVMLMGVTPATERVLARTGLTVDDVDVFEVNEAFASVVLAWQRDTGVDPDRVNPRGGAIAYGHPVGASGGRLTAALVDELHERGGRFGLQVMCESGGMANAMVVERL